MRGRWWLAPLACMTIPASPASAQSLPGTVFEDLRHAVSDMVAVWISPFRADGRDWATAGLVVGGIGASAVFDDEIAAWIRNHPRAGVLEVLEPVRETDGTIKLVNLGAGRSIHEIGAVLYVGGLVAGSAGVRDAAVGCVAAEKANGIVRHYVYKGVSRERPLYREIIGTDTIMRPGRPYDINFPSRDPWWDNSFFGGHGANVLSCISFLNHRFELGLAEPVLWTLGFGLNFGRMADQRHYLSDALLGAVFGYAIGKYVAERSLDRSAERKAESADDPVGGGGGFLREMFADIRLRPHGDGIAIAWVRRF